MKIGTVTPFFSLLALKFKIPCLKETPQNCDYESLYAI